MIKIYTLFETKAYLYSLYRGVLLEGGAGGEGALFTHFNLSSSNYSY